MNVDGVTCRVGLRVWERSKRDNNLAILAISLTVGGRGFIVKCSTVV